MSQKTRQLTPPPPRAFVDREVLVDWELSCCHPQLLEIIRLANVGLAAETHSRAIEDALAGMIARMPIAHISHFERALESLRRLKL